MNSRDTRLHSGSYDRSHPRPRILVLSTRSPFPPTQGDEVRLLGLVRGATALGDVTLAVWGEVQRCADEEVDVQLFPVSKLTSLVGTVGQGIRGGPLIVGPYARGFPLDSGHWDIAVGFQLKTWRWARRISAKIHVLDMVDALSRYALYPQLPLVKKLQLYGVGAEERRTLTAFDQVWISSEADFQHLVDSAGERMKVVPNGPLVVKPLPMPEMGKSLLFVGNLVYPPNRQGLIWFFQEVWPRLHGEGFSLEIVGKGSQGFTHAPGVRGHGLVDEVEPFYGRANLVISPVRWGGGSQSKIWEALGYGRRVVVTPEGGTAFGECPGLLIAEQAEDWVTVIRQGVRVRGGDEAEVPSVTANMTKALEAILDLAGG